MPEGVVRECIVRNIKLLNTDFDPLRAIGGEFADAVGIALEPKLPGQPRPPRKETTTLVHLPMLWTGANPCP
jgi:hypothetical protein